MSRGLWRCGLDVNLSINSKSISKWIFDTISSAILLICTALISNHSFAQTITPDGSTATTVITNAAGQQIVNIAPTASVGTAIDSISLNKYSRFDVPQAGIFLNNNAANARTIINEVTSAQRSLIEGAITVLGARANVILANPNGITVNGGQFINVGHVTLTTGTSSFPTQPIAPGINRTNIAYSVNGGRVEIGPNGLSGLMSSLTLAAHQVMIDGAITNTHPDPLSRTAIFTGNSRTVFKSETPPVNSNSYWGDNSSTGGSSVGAYLLDVTSNGRLTSGEIVIAINDLGAGVRQAGSFVASGKDLTLTADGDVLLQQGEFRIAQDGTISADNLRVSAGSQISASEGGLLVKTKNDIDNEGTLQGNKINADDAESVGGVTLKVGGKLRNYTTAKSALAVIFSESDALVIQADGDVENNAARLVSNGDVIIEAGLGGIGDFRNETEYQASLDSGVKKSSTYRGKRSLFSLFSRSKISETTTKYGKLRVEGETSQVFAGGDVHITADNMENSGGEVTTNSGDITIDLADTTGHLNNDGYTVGEVTFKTECNWLFCSRSGASDMAVLGGKIQAGGSIDIEADAHLSNMGGQIYAGQDLKLKSEKITAGSVEVLEVMEQPNGLRSLFSGTRVRMRQVDQGGSFRANGGKMEIISSNPIEFEGGEIKAAQGIDNPNGIVGKAELKPPKRIGGKRRHLGVFRPMILE